MENGRYPFSTLWHSLWLSSTLVNIWLINPGSQDPHDDSLCWPPSGPRPGWTQTTVSLLPDCILNNTSNWNTIRAALVKQKRQVSLWHNFPHSLYTERKGVSVCHTLVCLSTFNQMFINHMYPVSTQTLRHTHFSPLVRCQCICPKVIQATRRHRPLLWRMRHLPHTAVDQLELLKPNGSTPPVHLQSSKTLTPKTFQLWDSWSTELTKSGEEGHIKTFKHPHVLQTPPKTHNSDLCDWLCDLGIHELINHRLARVFICHVKHEHLNILLCCTSLPLPLTVDSTRCRPVLPRCRCTACWKERKKNSSLPASRCKNKPVVSRRDKQRRRKSKRTGKGGG